MKQILYLATCICLSTASFGQDTTASASIDSASAFYGNATSSKKTFSVNRDPVVHRRAFKVNTASGQAEVYERALGFVRMINADYTADKARGTITVPVTWQYKGGFNECVENMDLDGRLVIEIKGQKTRISLTDISYRHLDKNDGGKKPVAKSDFFTKYPDCAPSAGKVELLYNCSDCSRSISSIDKNLRAQFDNYASQYQERLKKY